MAFEEARAGVPGAFLVRELVDEMRRPQAPNASFGLGLMLDGEGRLLVFGHGGDDPGLHRLMGADARA